MISEKQNRVIKDDKDKSCIMYDLDKISKLLHSFGPSGYLHYRAYTMIPKIIWLFSLNTKKIYIILADKNTLLIKDH